MKPDIAIVGVAETAPVRRADKDIRALVVEAVLAALDDAGIAPEEVDGIVTDAIIMPTTVPHDYIAAQLGMKSRYDSAISLGGAGIVCAPLHAALAIQNGLADVVVCYFGVDWGTRASGPYGFHDLYPAKTAFEKPYGFNAQPAYFALWARRYMLEYGLTERQLGAVAVHQRRHAVLNGGGQVTAPLSIEDYLDSKLVSDPLRVPDCCLITDGAGAFVMTSAERARDCRAEPVYVKGVGFASEPITGDSAFTQKSDVLVIPGAREAADRAFAMADIGASDTDFAEIYDCFTISCLMQFEDMGLCEKGAAGAFFEAGEAGIGGKLPVNTHGGLLSYSYRLGIEHVVEATRQLRGDAGAAQVTDAELGLVSGLSIPDYGVLVLGRERGR
ncbi:MAG: thiolase family protein [Alphaproteobacteria bacterium]|jgi:acetyl-CoA acetyltransferase|nr:thiolase family protein [Alphaproteobacteria bacterium]